MGSYYRKTLSSQVKRIGTIESAIKKLCGYEDIIGHEEIILELARAEEMLCLEMRAMLRNCCIGSFHELDNQLCSSLNITIKKADDGYIITLPPLRHRKDYRENTAYIINPLLSAIRNFAADNRIIPFEKAEITICHCYQKDVPKYALPDYDNFETKKVLDVLAMHFLVDDNITRCGILHTSKETENPYTEITVKPMFKND